MGSMWIVTSLLGCLWAISESTAFIIPPILPIHPLAGFRPVHPIHPLPFHPFNPFMPHPMSFFNGGGFGGGFRRRTGPAGGFGGSNGRDDGTSAQTRTVRRVTTNVGGNIGGGAGGRVGGGAGGGVGGGVRVNIGGGRGGSIQGQVGGGVGGGIGGSVGGIGGMQTRADMSMNAGRNDVVLIINDRDCYNGICGGGLANDFSGLGTTIVGGATDPLSYMNYQNTGGIVDNLGGAAPIGNTGGFGIHDADTVVLGGGRNTQFLK